jgi:hypothetical protein
LKKKKSNRIFRRLGEELMKEIPDVRKPTEEEICTFEFIKRDIEKLLE